MIWVSDVWCARVCCFRQIGNAAFGWIYLQFFFSLHPLPVPPNWAEVFAMCLLSRCVRTQYRANCHERQRVCAKIKSKLAEIKWDVRLASSHCGFVKWLVLCCALQCPVLVSESISIAHTTKWNCQLLHIRIGSSAHRLNSNQINFPIQHIF